MSTLTIAVLSSGLIAGGDFPDPFDVRFGVDNGDGELGTLTSPSPSDVRFGVEYGGDGDQYTGIVIMPSFTSGDTFTGVWPLLYEAQTFAIGVAILVTIDGYCSNKPAIISEVEVDAIFVEGPHAENGGWNIQVRVSDLSGEPPKQTAITCNGDATGHALEVLSYTARAGIAYIVAADYSARNT